MTSIEIAPGIRKLGIAVASIRCSWSSCTKDGGQALEDATGRIRGSVTLAELRSQRVVRAYRDIMWRLGIDPTKVRPSSEALARRVLRGRGVRSISPAVDACNAASLATLVVISVFDASKVRPPLILRFARREEVFRDFSGRERVLTGREVVLTDSSGNILHLYPYRDSGSAPVNELTHEVIAVAYGAPGIGLGQLAEALHSFRDYLRRLCSGVSCSSVEVVR